MPLEVIRWMDAFAPIIEENLLLMSWIMGRQSTARFFTCSKEIGAMMRSLNGHAKINEQAAILHNVTPEQPLGLSQCGIDTDWLWAITHLTADRPPTIDNTFISWCPYCRQTFKYYFYAGVRYMYQGQFGGSFRILSDKQAIDNSEEDSDI